MNQSRGEHRVTKIDGIGKGIEQAILRLHFLSGQIPYSPLAETFYILSTLKFSADRMVTATHFTNHPYSIALLKRLASNLGSNSTKIQCSGVESKMWRTGFIVFLGLLATA